MLEAVAAVVWVAVDQALAVDQVAVALVHQEFLAQDPLVLVLLVLLTLVVVAVAGLQIMLEETQALVVQVVLELLFLLILALKKVQAELILPLADILFIHLQLVVHTRLNKGEINGPFCKSSRRQSHSGDCC
jgi:hypothetical protein